MLPDVEHGQQGMFERARRDAVHGAVAVAGQVQLFQTMPAGDQRQCANLKKYSLLLLL
jgi:hypothetical protein